MKFQALFTVCYILLSSAGAMVITVSSSNTNALVQRSLDLLEKSSSSQVFIGIAGGPGSGKSTLAESVCKAVNEECGQDAAIVIPMDGYHFSKSRLEEMGKKELVIGDTMAGNGGTTTTFQDLMSRRGAPWTFDSEALIRDLQQAKQHQQGSFPIYSREISDPVPNGVFLTPSQKIIYCEGNYLLSFDNANWKPLENIWDETWYILVPEEVVKERLINRHLENWNDSKVQMWGSGRNGALCKVEASDLKNYRWIQETSRNHADVIIEN